ncbi:MAG: hypothetical protein A2X08_15710 [Bacteroidetes bacterium GWA2_32_17]|nr:MAG: hypothetical protein A2X08_15710 [Bacteroidetes bacterium GWA2_32_17]
MKIFGYILSIYILTLLAYPCQDDCSYLLTNNTNNSANHNHNEQDCNSCSPFCTCNCCHVSTIISFNAIINKASTIPVLINVIYKESFIKDIFFTIWQPPKL